MAEIAIFEDDAFSVSSLTAAINDQEYLPGRISSLGLFREEGISTLTVQIEKDGDTLALVPAGELHCFQHQQHCAEDRSCDCAGDS